MFPSCGIFGNVSCPVARRGLCERPHCFYKHGASARDENGNLCAASGTPVSVETQDDGFHELERINKEIETVRQEVEVEQRRLSGCQTAQERSTKHGPSLKYAPYSTKVDGGPSNLYKTAKPATSTTACESKVLVICDDDDDDDLAKSRLQPQVLVPFRGPVASGSGSQPPLASKIKQIQQTACVAHTASVNRGQAPLKKPETQSTPPALTPPLKAAAPQNGEYAGKNKCDVIISKINYPQFTFIYKKCALTWVVALYKCIICQFSYSTAYLNPLPGRGTVIAIDSNLHLLVPDGAVALPVNPTAVPASILTPIGRAPAGPMPPPAKIRFSLMESVPGKRKPKHFETAKDKVPHDVRQRYVNMFTEEFLKTTPNVNEAFQKALTEEKVVYSRSMNKVKYQSVAVNALKRLRNQSTVVTTADDVDLYKALKDYILTDERLIENNYPILNPERRGCAVLFSGSKRASTDRKSA
uniref:RNA exonuclease 1 homolog-like domain-containing protein n=1 Tax=Salarias fasciatus TaxID=181472 RepID=A0A672HB76_SALFA